MYFDAKKRFGQTMPWLMSWSAAILTGLVAVFYARSFAWIEELAIHFYKHLSPVTFSILSGLCFMCSVLVVHIFASTASGSGIPQVLISRVLLSKEYFYETKVYLGLRNLVVKVVSSLICVLGGGAIGREGPTIQIGAGIFYHFASIARNRSYTINKEAWIIAGGSAGIAAAFNTPLGGIVYAVEELSSTHFNRFKTVLLSAIILAGMIAQWLTGPYLYIGYPVLTPIVWKTVPWILLIGLISGWFGAQFGKILYVLNSWRENNIKSLKKLLLLAFSVGVGLSIMAVLGGVYSLGPGKILISDLLFSSENIGNKGSLFLIRFLGPIITYMSGVAGGIFAPSLAAGGILGSWFSELIQLEQYGNLFTLLGMIGFMTGLTRAPFTSFILVLEMTDRHSAIFPMMMVALISVLISRTVEEGSLYHNTYENFLKKFEASEKEKEEAKKDSTTLVE